MKAQLAGDLMTAIALLPNDHYVTFKKEQDEEDARWILTACVFQTAPEDGWPSSGARLRDPLSAPSHKVACPPQWAHDDSVIFGVGAATPDVLERLLIDAITGRWGAL